MHKVNFKKTQNVGRACLNWLDTNGYFARKIYMDGLMLILAIKDGQVYGICTGTGDNHDPQCILPEIEKSGGHVVCVASADDLEHYFTTGVQR